jgi:hypothetical protein
MRIESWLATMVAVVVTLFIVNLVLPANVKSNLGLSS